MSHKSFVKAIQRWFWHRRSWVLTYHKFLEMGVEHGILKPTFYDPVVHGKRRKADDDCNPVAVMWLKEAKPGDRIYVVVDEEE